VVTGPKGERVVPIENFFLSLFTTALQPDEILTEVRVPIPPPRSAGAYLKLERKVGDFATAAVAVQVTLDERGGCQKAGMGLTNVGATPVKARKAEAFLLGKRLDEGSIAQAAQLAADEAEPSADLRGPVEYKEGLVKELAKRAMLLARERVGK